MGYIFAGVYTGIQSVYRLHDGNIYKYRRYI